MNKLGPHIQIPGSGLDLIERWKPPVCLLMDAGGDYVQRVRQKSPNAKIAVRKYEDNRDWRGTDPGWWAGQIWEMVRPFPPDYCVSWNMPLSHDAHGDFADFDRWSVEFAAAARRLGMEPLGLCMSTGNFTGAADRVKVSEAFPQTCQAYNVLAAHDYSWPTMWDGLYWYCLRWTKWHEDIQAAFGKDMRFLIMECGLTQHVIAGRPDRGWRDDVDDAPTDEEYIDILSWYNSQLCQLDYCLGACVYNFYGYGRWASFEHKDKPEVVNAIIGFDAPASPPEQPEEPEQPEQPEPPPEEPTGGSMDNIRVYMWDPDQEKPVELTSLADKEELIYGKYGAAFRRAEAVQGQQVYRLTELWEKTGHASLVSTVLDESGKPVNGADVAFYWPDAPDPPDPPTEVTAHDWHRNFIHGPTNANGDIGPGMGKGAYHGRGEGGPHAVWVRDPNIPSDICEKLGMLAGTFHDHLDQKFKLVTVGEEPQQPSEEDDYMWRETNRTFASGPSQIVLYVSGGNLFDMRGDMRCGSWQLPDPVHPQEGGVLVFDTTYPEEETRTYVAWIFRLSDGERMSDEVACKFGPDKRGTYSVYLEWKTETEEPEEPPVEPPAGDEELAELWRDLATVKRAQAANLDTEAAICDAMAEKYETD